MWKIAQVSQSFLSTGWLYSDFFKIVVLHYFFVSFWRAGWLWWNWFLVEVKYEPTLEIKRMYTSTLNTFEWRPQLNWLKFSWFCICICQCHRNKLASLEAMLAQNSVSLTDSWGWSVELLAELKTWKKWQVNLPV